MSKTSNDESNTQLIQRHLLIGWGGLLLFLSLGIVLETMHGLKMDFYLDLRNEARRLMWTLAHSHGTLFSIINIIFALTLSVVGRSSSSGLTFVSWMLVGAITLMPTGFFLGGLVLTGSEPGVGVFLVPVGALLLLMAVCGTLLTVRGWAKQPAASQSRDKSNRPSKSGRR